jgi:hypothetical protein
MQLSLPPLPPSYLQILAAVAGHVWWYAALPVHSNCWGTPGQADDSGDCVDVGMDCARLLYRVADSPAAAAIDVPRPNIKLTHAALLLWRDAEKAQTGGPQPQQEQQQK